MAVKERVPQQPMRRVLRAGLLLTGAATFSAWIAEATACSGPCSEPALFDLLPYEERPIIVTNFGLLQPADDGWRLECEEVMGGLLLRGLQLHGRTFASTSNGLVAQHQECRWPVADAGAGVDWLIDVTSWSGASDDDAHVFALQLDEMSNEIVVARSLDGDVFEGVQRFPSSLGLRWVRISGAEPTVYVMGTFSDPPTLVIEQSNDLGNTWQEHAFPIGMSDPQRVPLASPMAELDGLPIRGTYLASDREELWVFNPSSGLLEPKLSLPVGERIGGLAISKETLYLAARGGTETQVYAAANDGAFDFAAAFAVPTPLTCLHQSSGALYACSNDFSRSSPWLLARSSNRGESWEPLLQINDLGELDSCSGCESTNAWLRGTYGVIGNFGTPSDRALDAGSSDPGSKTEETRRLKSRGSCSVTGALGGNAGSWIVLLYLLLVSPFGLRRRQAWHPNPTHHPTVSNPPASSAL